MAIITIKKDSYCYDIPFRGEEYTVDTSRKFGGYEPGDLICYIWPFFGVPLKLEIAIRADGSLIFRSWTWKMGENSYLHTTELPPEKCNEDRPYPKPFIPTQAQCETVSGLFSGRITFEGLRLAPGASLQDVCPIDVQAEEARCGKKIYLA